MTPEKNFENRIKDYLARKKIWFIKFFANRNTKSGIPDILACINGYFVAIEVKAQTGNPSKLQLYTCNKIRDSGGFAYIVYPSGFEKLKQVIENLEKEIFNINDNLILK